MSGRRRAQPSSGVTTIAIASSPWIVVGIGVLVMVVLLVVAVVAVPVRRAPDALPPRPPVTAPRPPSFAPTREVAAELPVTPGLSPRSSLSPTPAGTPTRPQATSPVRTGATTRPASRPPAPPSVVGRYRVLNRFPEAFIGEVLVTNVSGRRQDWTVRLSLSRGQLVTAWIEGAPQGTVTRSGDQWVFTSGTDLAAGASVPLRFHFERTGRGTRPQSCTVDGIACSGL